MAKSTTRKTHRNKSVAKTRKALVVGRKSSPRKSARSGPPQAATPPAAKPRAARPQAAKHRGDNGAPRGLNWVYAFGGGKAAGRADMRNLLGGKGAGLAEMANLGLPVPPGFTITTEVCTAYYAGAKTYPKDLARQVDAALAEIGRITGRTF